MLLRALRSAAPSAARLSTLSTLAPRRSAAPAAWPAASALASSLASAPSQASPPSPASQAPARRRRHPRRAPAPRLRVDARVGALLSGRTAPAAFVRAVDALTAADEVALLAHTDPRAWSLALRRRLAVRDEQGARALLDLVAGFARENTTRALWTDLLFALLRFSPADSALAQPETLRRMLDALGALHGRAFVGDVVVSAVNGLAKLALFAPARELVRYHLDRLRTSEDEEVPPIPASIVGNVASCMADRGLFDDVVDFVERDLLSHDQFDAARDFQQQGFLALFRAYAATLASPTKGVNEFIDWAWALADQMDENGVRQLQLERGFGAAIQCCVAAERPSLALRCFDELKTLNERFVGPLDPHDSENIADRRARYKLLVAPADENIYVNALKASTSIHDTGRFHDVYREMVDRGVARSPGFGSAIRFCRVRHDSEFLEGVLEDAFACESALQGEWLLEIEQYNDALGCFTETKSYDLARELFEARLLHNPFLRPDHITMVEMVESYREATLSELFHLMEAFLEMGLTPNTQVYTSLLDACARQRLAGDADALLESMGAQGIKPDVKTLTTVGFIYGAHGNLNGVVGLIRTLRDEGLVPDQKFFDYVLNALYESSGIDVCFALLGEVCAAGFTVPEGLYHALISLGISRGLVERTLHVAYNMECDGFTLSSEQMLGLIDRSASDAEVAQLARTFLLLHDDFLRPSSAETTSNARFELDVYDAMDILLSRFGKKEALAKVRELAERARDTHEE